MNCSICRQGYQYPAAVHHITCAKRGALSPDFVRKHFLTAGAKIETRDYGRILVSAERRETVGRVQTLIGDMRRAGFKVRWVRRDESFLAMRVETPRVEPMPTVGQWPECQLAMCGGACGADICGT